MEHWLNVFVPSLVVMGAATVDRTKLDGTTVDRTTLDKKNNLLLYVSAIKQSLYYCKLD